MLNHLIKLKTDGKAVDLTQFITPTEIERVKKAYKELENPTALRPIFDHLKEEISYEKIKIALVM